MPQVAGAELEIFYCYAREDDALRRGLEIHLSGPKRDYHLKHWDDSEINPGEEWEQTINEHLDTADIIFVLISPDFLDSDYCYGKEMQRALERAKQGTCRIVPILLRPTLWEDMPFSKLQLLPTDARAITSWPNRDEAFNNVAIGINKVLKELVTLQSTALYWLTKGNALSDLNHFDDALSAYEHAILLDPSYPLPWYHKSLTLQALGKPKEAQEAREKARQLGYPPKESC